MDLDLAAQLEHYVVVDYLFFCDHLYGDYGFGGPLFSQIHMPILPFT